MKYVLGAVLCCISILFAHAQVEVSGHVTSDDAAPVAAATVTLKKSYKTILSTTTNDEGYYKFQKVKQMGEYQLLIEHVSMQPKQVTIHVAATVTIVDVAVSARAYNLQPLEVRSLRASAKAPFAKTDLTKEEIAKTNLGQDLPFVLNQTPGVVVNSDAGTGVGYTGIHIRGSDATRINVTLNGVPFNDAESMGTYFVDIPDIVSSVNSIQIQRGVGTSSNGAGAFGASINLSTNEVNEQPYGETNNSYGSFNTWKNTVKAGTGLIDNHFTFDTRLSRITSDGYIDRASTNLKSLQLSAAYISSKSSVRFNIISGTEKTYQAWNGIPEAKLNNDTAALLTHYYNNVGYLYFTPADSANLFNSAPQKFNVFTYPNQTDNYTQTHYQLFFNHTFNKRISINTGLFLVDGKGYYEEYKPMQSYSAYGLADPVFGSDTLTTTDLVRQLWLDNKFYGQIASAQYKAKASTVTVGGAWNRYDGKHYGNVTWANAGVPKDYRWYNLTALKDDWNVYAKLEHALQHHLYVYADVQYRSVFHRMNGFRDNPTLVVLREFDFINPKAGITYSNKGLLLFVSYALGNKEPNRDDFEAGTLHQPTHETLHDLEAGYAQSFHRFSVGATGYYMRYKNQLILTGKINDVGAYTRVNVPNSYRMGVELEGKLNASEWLRIAANIAFSKNKIENSEEYVDDYDNGGQAAIKHHNTDISFSPSIVGGATVTFIPLKNAELSFISKYVSRQYLDNTQTLGRSLKPYFVEDARFSYTLKNMLFKDCSIIAAAYNVFNKNYEANGYTYSYITGGKTTTENFYFPMAGVNWIAGISVRL